MKSKLVALPHHRTTQQAAISSTASWKWLASLAVLLALVLLATRGLWRPELIRSFDMEFHAARTANYYLALKQGQWPPRWAPNLNSGFGYPVFLMVYPLPYIVSTAALLVTNSVEWSLNLVTISSMIMASLGMWLVAGWVTRRPGPAVIAGWWYALSPYLLLTVYVKGAVAEALFLGLLPWVWLLLLARKQQGSLWWQVISYLIFVATLLAHHLSIMILAPVVLSWIVLQWWPELTQHKTTKASVLSWWQSNWRLVFVGLASLATVMFFWLPMVVEKQFTRVARDEMVQHYYEDFVTLPELIWSPWGYGGFSPNVEHESFTKMLGWSSWLMLGIGGWVVLRKFLFKVRSARSLKLSAEWWFWFSWLMIAITLMLPASQVVWETFAFLKYLQFPWRFLWLAVFCSVMLGLETWRLFFNSHMIVEWQKLQWLVVMVVVSTTIWSAWFWAKPIGYFGHDLHYWLEYPGRSSSFAEFDTIWFNPVSNPRLTETVLLRPMNTRVFDDSDQVEPHRWGEVELLYWSGHNMRYRVSLPQEGHVLQRTMFFPGWHALVDGQPATIEHLDDEFAGRIALQLPAGEHEVTVQFSNLLWDRRAADYLSLSGILAASGLWLYSAFRYGKANSDQKKTSRGLR